MKHLSYYKYKIVHYRIILDMLQFLGTFTAHLIGGQKFICVLLQNLHKVVSP